MRPEHNGGSNQGSCALLEVRACPGATGTHLGSTPFLLHLAWILLEALRAAALESIAVGLEAIEGTVRAHAKTVRSAKRRRADLGAGTHRLASCMVSLK